MKRGLLLTTGLLLALALGACAREPIHKAVAGELVPAEENAVVVNHCQGCHLHAKFVAETHMAKVKARYAPGNSLRDAARCLQCHRLSLENIFRNEIRRTEFPHGALVSLPDVPKPSDQPQVSGQDKKEAAKPEEKKKERKWYFFWLF